MGYLGMIHKVTKSRQISLLSLRDGEATLSQVSKWSDLPCFTKISCLNVEWLALQRKHILVETLSSKEASQMVGCGFKPVLKEYTVFKHLSVCTPPPGQNKLSATRRFLSCLGSWSRYTSCKAQLDHHNLTSGYCTSKSFLTTVLPFQEVEGRHLEDVVYHPAIIKHSTTTNFRNGGCEK